MALADQLEQRLSVILEKLIGELPYLDNEESEILTRPIEFRDIPAAVRGIADGYSGILGSIKVQRRSLLEEHRRIINGKPTKAEWNNFRSKLTKFQHALLRAFILSVESDIFALTNELAKEIAEMVRLETKRMGTLISPDLGIEADDNDPLPSLVISISMCAVILAVAHLALYQNQPRAIEAMSVAVEISHEYGNMDSRLTHLAFLPTTNNRRSAHTLAVQMMEGEPVLREALEEFPMDRARGGLARVSFAISLPAIAEGNPEAVKDNLINSLLCESAAGWACDLLWQDFAGTFGVNRNGMRAFAAFARASIANPPIGYNDRFWNAALSDLEKRLDALK